MISTADPSINFSSQNNFDFPPVRRQNWVMIENANSSDDANEEIIALLVMLDERDAEIARLRERVRWLEFTPERAAERIKERTHPALAPFKAEDGPRGNMGQPLMPHEELYAFMQKNWPTPASKKTR